ncbi:hypothetical protein NC652_024409 [Populus alba x Populus x berolinensis]|nr:hypothetical protein NC652_024409 [Populus alba x Populus x berolinensis]
MMVNGTAEEGPSTNNYELRIIGVLEGMKMSYSIAFLIRTMRVTQRSSLHHTSGALLLSQRGSGALIPVP